jgi:hypothetical protein
MTLVVWLVDLWHGLFKPGRSLASNFGHLFQTESHGQYERSESHMAVVNRSVGQPPISHLTMKLQNVFMRELVSVGFIAASAKLIERAFVYFEGLF